MPLTHAVPNESAGKVSFFTSHAFGLQMKFFLAFCHIVGIGLNLTRTQLKDCIEKLLRDHQHIQNLELSDLVRIGGGANAPERFTNLSLWSAANHFTNNTLCCSSSHFYPFIFLLSNQTSFQHQLFFGILSLVGKHNCAGGESVYCGA